MALLAFNKIVISHPHIVALHQATILDCIDDQDVSIRLQALELGSGMINSDNLISVVNRLMKQLRDAEPSYNPSLDESKYTNQTEPTLDSDGEDSKQMFKPARQSRDDTLAIPEEYKVALIRQVLDMCSRDTYASITNFEWYIQTLVELVRHVPFNMKLPSSDSTSDQTCQSKQQANSDVSRAIGAELRNVAVRVNAVREDVVLASNSLLAIDNRDNLYSRLGIGGQGILEYAAWIVGEYSEYLLNPRDTLDSLLLPLHGLDFDTICAYLQAIPKVLAAIIVSGSVNWSTDHQTMISLLLARIICFLESFTTHPKLEIQERSVEFSELMRLAAEAVNAHRHVSEIWPLFLTEGIPALFHGIELNPVAVTAQRRVPLPIGLDLDHHFNNRLATILLHAEQENFESTEDAEVERLYYHRSTTRETAEALPDTLPSSYDDSSSYQENEALSVEPSDLIIKRRQRYERHKDDPFYIANPDEISSGSTTPFHDILKRSNGLDVDIDSIPIIDLDLESKFDTAYSNSRKGQGRQKHLQQIQVTADENIDHNGREVEQNLHQALVVTQGKEGTKSGRAKKSLLEVDSSGIGGSGLEESEGFERRGKELEDVEMAKALAEVERLRLEMQRASERISVAEDIPIEGILIKKKKKKKQNKHKDRKASLREEGKEVGIGLPPQSGLLASE